MGDMETVPSQSMSMQVQVFKKNMIEFVQSVCSGKAIQKLVTALKPNLLIRRTMISVSGSFYAWTRFLGRLWSFGTKQIWTYLY